MGPDPQLPHGRPEVVDRRRSGALKDAPARVGTMELPSVNPSMASPDDCMHSAKNRAKSEFFMGCYPRPRHGLSEQAPRRRSGGTGRHGLAGLNSPLATGDDLLPRFVGGASWRCTRHKETDMSAHFDRLLAEALTTDRETDGGLAREELYGLNTSWCLIDEIPARTRLERAFHPRRGGH